MCPTTNDWLTKMYIYSMEYYSAIKNNEIMSFSGKWIELDSTMLSVISQAQKDSYVEYRPKRINNMT
jgi:hypothetical protein